MKNILIPTDFTIKSLKLINRAVARFPDTALHITLVHALEPDHSISGLLMLNKRLNVHSLYTTAFLEACEVLRNKYGPAIEKIKVEFYYGSTKAYCKSFLEARNIDAILFAEDYELELPSPSSREAREVWSKSNCPVFQERIQNEQRSDQHAPAEAWSLSELLQV